MDADDSGRRTRALSDFAAALARELADPMAIVQGRLRILLGLTIADGKIIAIDAIADPEQLAQLDVQIFTD